MMEGIGFESTSVAMAIVSALILGFGLWIIHRVSNL